MDKTLLHTAGNEACLQLANAPHKTCSAARAATVLGWNWLSLRRSVKLVFLRHILCKILQSTYYNYYFFANCSSGTQVQTRSIHVLYPSGLCTVQIPCWFSTVQYKQWVSQSGSILVLVRKVTECIFRPNANCLPCWQWLFTLTPPTIVWLSQTKQQKEPIW